MRHAIRMNSVKNNYPLNMHISDLEAVLLRMARTAAALGKVRQGRILARAQAQGMSRVHSLDSDQPPPRWWVLVCGEALDSVSLTRRDNARDRLLKEMQLHGLRLTEYVWVWDETNQAQVVAGEFARRDQADAFARKLNSKGLRVRVVREMEEDSGRVT